MIILKHKVIFCVSKLHQTSHVNDGNNCNGQTNIWYLFEGTSIFIFIFFRSPHFENPESEM